MLFPQLVHVDLEDISSLLIPVIQRSSSFLGYSIFFTDIVRRFNPFGSVTPFSEIIGFPASRYNLSNYP
ncbi:protein of unknown function [Candidatus Nitrosotalea okcheonensis]|uniref:Uncharacterized protein n=1 Tax=Candidatus Nitrosotalea okcheonensis TaxID=1903276 RepID=A0A2H1FFW1_9ARCH|nr:protein of unknown function [Candidatus Nitrosotalea okcheonensis]